MLQCCDGERMAQRQGRLDERRARHVQAEEFQHHLVGVGRAVKRAGAHIVVGAEFR